MSSEALIVNIEKLSKIKGVSKTKALTDSGAGKDLVSNVKKGQNPSIDKLERLADYFNVSVDYLLGRTEHMNCSGNIDSIITHGSDNIINSNNNNINQPDSNITRSDNNQKSLDETSVQVAEMFQNLDIQNKAKVLSYMIEVTK